MREDTEAIRQRALGLLARREHSAEELVRKLTAKGYSIQDISEIVAELIQDGSLSDQRFAESFIHNRVQRGHGPIRIKQELKERGVDAHLIDSVMSEKHEDWAARIREVHAKKFGNDIPGDFKEKVKQTRFLQYRGFTTEQIRRLFNRE